MKRRVISVAVVLVVTASASPLIAQDAALVRARTLLASTPLIDGHMLRVLGAAETAATRLAAQRPPSTATIEALDGKKAP